MDFPRTGEENTLETGGAIMLLETIVSKQNHLHNPEQTSAFEFLLCPSRAMLRKKAFPNLHCTNHYLEIPLDVT